MSEDSLYHLVYASTATAPFSAEQLTELLKQARAKNKRMGVTGALFLRDDQFVQYIEGNHPDVLSLYSTIENDSRHHGLSVLSRGKLKERAFSRWSMAFDHLSATFAAEDEESAVFLRSSDWLNELGSSSDEHLAAIRQFVLA